MKRSKALTLVKKELDRARTKFPAFYSVHDGYAITLEELDELWDTIKRNRPKEELIEEAKQVAAMAIRFLIDVC